MDDFAVAKTISVEAEEEGEGGGGGKVQGGSPKNPECTSRTVSGGF